MERIYQTNGLDMSPLLRSISIVSRRTRAETSGQWSVASGPKTRWIVLSLATSHWPLS